jgi:ankyrin repeat protein
VEKGISLAEDVYEDPQQHLITLELHQLYNSGQADQSNEPLLRLTVETKCLKFPFLKYAACYLGYHLRQLPSGQLKSCVMELVTILLQERPKRNLLCRLLFVLGLYDSDSKLDIWREFPDDDSHMEAQALSQTSDLGTWDLSPEGILLRYILQRLDDMRDQKSSEGPRIYESTDQVHESVTTPAAQKEITPLHLAAFVGWVPLVTKMAEDSADINAIDPYGRSPIVVAIQEDHFDVVSILLRLGATVDLTSADGHAVMLHAAKKDYRDIVHSIISRALNPLQEADRMSILENLNANLSFLYAVLLVLLQHISLLVSQIFRSENTNTGKPDPPGKRANQFLGSFESHLQLLVAAESGDAEMIRRLVREEKISFTIQSSLFHMTALFLAVEFSHTAAAKALIESGVDINTRGLQGNTALHRAASRDDIDMVKMILENKPDIDIPNGQGLTAWSANAGEAHRDGMLTGAAQASITMVTGPY